VRVDTESGESADYRGGVTCLYDTQLLGACLHASESGGRSRPEAVRGMPEVPIAPPTTARRLSALSAQPLSTGGCGRVCLGFWVLDLRFWGRKESGSGSAAHNAVGLAGESPVVGIDCLPTYSYSTLAWGDPASASSNVNVLERRASQLAGRNM